MKQLTTRADRILNMADAIAESYGGQAVGVEHILFAIIDEDNSMAAAAIREAGCTAVVRALLEKHMQNGGSSSPRDTAM